VGPLSFKGAHTLLIPRLLGFGGFKFAALGIPFLPGFGEGFVGGLESL